MRHNFPVMILVKINQGFKKGIKISKERFIIPFVQLGFANIGINLPILHFGQQNGSFLVKISSTSNAFNPTKLGK